MPNGRCRMHGGPSRGALTPEGKARLSDKAKAEWAAWRAERKLPPEWRNHDNQVCGLKRESAAAYLTKYGPWKPEEPAT